MESLGTTLCPGTTEILKLYSNVDATVFIRKYAISFPRHILGPALNAGYWNGEICDTHEVPSSENQRSGRKDFESEPQMLSILPMP